MSKLPLVAMDDAVHLETALGAGDCLRCSCNDICCAHGADVDRLAYQLIEAHQEMVQAHTGTGFETWFGGAWSGDTEFLGGDSIRSRIGAQGSCVFRFPNRRGCVLFKLVRENGLPGEIIPSICRLFPLTWHNGVLKVYGTEDIPALCSWRHTDALNRRDTVVTRLKPTIEAIFQPVVGHSRELD